VLNRVAARRPSRRVGRRVGVGWLVRAARGPAPPEPAGARVVVTLIQPTTARATVEAPRLSGLAGSVSTPKRDQERAELAELAALPTTF